MNSAINILCLPKPELRLEHLYGRNGFAVGFSHTNNRRLFRSFKTIPITIIPMKVCTDIYAVGDKRNIPIGIQTDMICANSHGSNHMSVGDSGMSTVYYVESDHRSYRRSSDGDIQRNLLSDRSGIVRPSVHCSQPSKRLH